MPNTLTRKEIARARAHGEKNVSSIVAKFRSDMDPLTKQLALKQLYGQRVEPIQKAIENFDLKNFHERQTDPEILKIIMLASFQAVAEIDTICKLMEQNRVDEYTRRHFEIVQEFADRRKWDLCRAFHTYATDGKVEATSPADIVSLEVKMARKGLFPLDILRGLVMPLRMGPSPENAS